MMKVYDVCDRQSREILHRRATLTQANAEAHKYERRSVLVRKTSVMPEALGKRDGIPMGYNREMSLMTQHISLMSE